MMQRNRTLAMIASGVGALAVAGHASAFVTWTNTNGSTADFDWVGGGSDNGLFGDPTVIGNTFVFFPSMFRAESIDGASDQVIDRLEVELIAKGAFNFTDVVISEFGDFGIVGIGSVTVTGGLFVTDLENLNPNFTPRVATDSLVSLPGSPITSGTGNWTASAGVDLANWDGGPIWTRIKVVLNNVLIATTDGPGSTAFIEKKVGGISIEIIPTPGAMPLFAFAGLAAIRRRR
jgi:uncharacterized protein (TIGR03382 family)